MTKFLKTTDGSHFYIDGRSVTRDKYESELRWHSLETKLTLGKIC